MIRWELCEVVAGSESGRVYFYRTEESRETNSLRETRRLMARLAAEGWELVSVVEEDDLFYYHFKRPLTG